MAEYWKLDMGEGAELYIQAVETSPSGAYLEASAEERQAAKAQEVFEKALPAVADFAKNAAESIRRDSKPDELEISFSVGLNTDLKAVISSVGVNAGFSVKLKWKEPGKA